MIEIAGVRIVAVAETPEMVVGVFGPRPTFISSILPVIIPGVFGPKPCFIAVSTESGSARMPVIAAGVCKAPVGPAATGSGVVGPKRVSSEFGWSIFRSVFLVNGVCGAGLLKPGFGSMFGSTALLTGVFGPGTAAAGLMGVCGGATRRDEFGRSDMAGGARLSWIRASGLSWGVTVTDTTALVGGAAPCLDFALRLGMDIAALGGGGLEAPIGFAGLVSTAGRSGWPAPTAESAGVGTGSGSASLGPSPGSLAASTLSFSLVILGAHWVLQGKKQMDKVQVTVINELCNNYNVLQSGPYSFKTFRKEASCLCRSSQTQSCLKTLRANSSLCFPLLFTWPFAPLLPFFPLPFPFPFFVPFKATASTSSCHSKASGTNFAKHCCKMLQRL